MNSTLNFKKSYIDPVTREISQLGESRLAKTLDAVFKAHENSFYKHRIINAFRLIDADLRKGINKEIVKQLREKAGYESPPGVDYYGVIESAVRSIGVTGAEQDDLVQSILAEMFTKGGKDFFTLFETDRQKDFSKFLYARARWRAQDFVKQRGKQLKREKSISPHGEGDEGPAIDPKAPIESLEDKASYKQYLELIDKGLEKTRPALRLKELWHHLLEGRTPTEVAEAMGLKPPNVTKRLHDLKAELLKIADEHGWSDLESMIRRQLKPVA